MSAPRRADDHVIKLHAMHITRIPRLVDRRKAIAMFEDTYGGGAVAKLKGEIERLWPLREGDIRK